LHYKIQVKSDRYIQANINSAAATLGNMQWRNLSRSTKVGLVFLVSVVSFGAIYRLLDKLGYIFPIALWSEIFCEACPTNLAYHQPPIGVESIANSQPIDKLLGAGVNKASISILIEKSQLRLTIYQDKRPIKSYPIVLGEQPQGDKFTEGDRRTPEGIFHLRDLYPHSEWSKFLWLDYPNAGSWRKHLAAKQAGKIPWYQPIGSDVGIHGVPTDRDKLIDQKVNWTWGCISLKTADVDEIYQVSRSGTLVEILP
jgi:L,D-transpeptidase catalytic domain